MIRSNIRRVRSIKLNSDLQAISLVTSILSDSAILPNLKQLCFISDRELDFCDVQLCRLPALQQLQIRNQESIELPVQSLFAQPCNLIHLKLLETSLTPQTVMKICEACHLLEHLELQHCGDGDSQMPTTSRFSLRHLKYLDVQVTNQDHPSLLFARLDVPLGCDFNIDIAAFDVEMLPAIAPRSSPVAEKFAAASHLSLFGARHSIYDWTMQIISKSSLDGCPKDRLTVEQTSYRKPMFSPLLLTQIEQLVDAVMLTTLEIVLFNRRVEAEESWCGVTAYDWNSLFDHMAGLTRLSVTFDEYKWEKDNPITGLATTNGKLAVLPQLRRLDIFFCGITLQMFGLQSIEDALTSRREAFQERLEALKIASADFDSGDVLPKVLQCALDRWKNDVEFLALEPSKESPNPYDISDDEMDDEMDYY
jgi:hypothetical protein